MNRPEHFHANVFWACMLGGYVSTVILQLYPSFIDAFGNLFAEFSVKTLFAVLFAFLNIVPLAFIALIKFLFGCIFGLPGLLLALRVAPVLDRRGQTSPHAWLAAGLAIGTINALLLDLFLRNNDPAMTCLHFSMAGMFAGFFFWWITYKDVDD